MVLLNSSDETPPTRDDTAHWGFWAPVSDEIDAGELPVTGTLPSELTGRYLRNGPNPRPGDAAGLVPLGQGMVHGVRLRDGKAIWYRNRWVRTAAFDGAPRVRPDGTRDLAVNPANTHVIAHAGRILALVESGLPYRLSPELATVGPVDFDGRLTTAMTAHPKQDPVTGDLHLFGYATEPPFVTYHRVSAAGELVASRPVAVPGPTMMHDFAITARHVVWLDLPMTFRADLAGGLPYQWDERYGARFGVMCQDDPWARVTWFDIDPCYIFHVGGAHEDESGRIVLDAVRYSPASITALWDRLDGRAENLTEGSATPAPTGLYRWVLDPATGSVTEQPVDEPGTEFPTMDDALVGRPSRYRYLVRPATMPGERQGAIVKHDLDSGTSTRHELDPEVVAGEAVFVPATDGTRREDDGWLLSIVTRRDGTASRLLVLDASDPTAAPVAAVRLPRGVPAGFHGSWIPDDALGAR